MRLSVHRRLRPAHLLVIELLLVRTRLVPVPVAAASPLVLLNDGVFDRLPKAENVRVADGADRDRAARGKPGLEALGVEHVLGGGAVGSILWRWLGVDLCIHGVGRLEWRAAVQLLQEDCARTVKDDDRGCKFLAINLVVALEHFFAKSAPIAHHLVGYVLKLQVDRLVADEVLQAFFGGAGLGRDDLRLRSVLQRADDTGQAAHQKRDGNLTGPVQSESCIHDLLALPFLIDEGEHLDVLFLVERREADACEDNADDAHEQCGHLDNYDPLSGTVIQ